MKIQQLLIVFAITISACAELEKPQLSNSTLVVFGDSLSDVGNARIASAGLLPDKNYFMGRFSNGEIYVDKLAAALKTEMKPSRSFGSNYAFAGNSSLAVNAQVFNYSENVDGFADPNAVYILWSGANDLLAALLTPDEASQKITDAITHIKTAVLNLSSIGAKNILVLNQVNMARLPKITQSEDLAEGSIGNARSLSIQFNTALKSMLDALMSDGDLALIRFDVFTLFEDVVSNPGMFDLTNVVDACYLKDEAFAALTGEETICDNASEYLFWDSIHPTTTAHDILFQRLFVTIEAIQ